MTLVATAQLDRLSVFGSVTLSLTHLLRGAPFTSKTPPQGEEASLVLVLTGSLLADRGPAGRRSGRRTFPAGSAFIAVEPAGHRLLATADSSVLIAQAPLSLFSDISLPSDDLHPVSTDMPLLAPASAFMRSAADGDRDLSTFDEYFIERLLHEMLIGVFVGSMGARSLTQALDPFAAAQSVIAAQRSDPSLTAEGVAREVNLSVRQLERVFRARQTTIRQEIRTARIRHAMELLGDPGYGALSVGELARFCGFSNGSSLARAMRTAGFPSPASVRRGSATAPNPTPQIPNAT